MGPGGVLSYVVGIRYWSTKIGDFLANMSWQRQPCAVRINYHSEYLRAARGEIRVDVIPVGGLTQHPPCIGLHQ